MAALWLLLLAAATPAESALPAGRPARDPLPAAHPTAELLRGGDVHEHSLLAGDDEPISEEQMAAGIDGFLRARGGRFSPLWENHSHAERTANLQRHANRRRRLQNKWSGSSGVAAAYAGQLEQASLAGVVDEPASVCDDPLATNAGQQPLCTYSCDDLRREYFPEPQSQTTRCFLFAPATNTWPEVGGQGAELLAMRQQRFETHNYVSREDGTSPPAAGVSFAVGVGRVCRNVTIEATLLDGGITHVEEVCLVDGEHEYDHTISEAHTVEVVGYAESDVHEGAGGTTRFVVGECVDVLIRVTTTSAGGDSVRWSLDDGGHNGPWLFDSSGAVFEQESCMFANDFTLTKLSSPASWQGSVEVVGFIHYRNTITIPNDENWIVQGRVDPDSGLPSALDGRFKSGTAVERSRANIVLRHLRISGQVAPIDVNEILRVGSLRGRTAGYGGAFEYDGGSSDPSNLVKLVFVGIVFDHCAAGSGGGSIFIDGRAAQATADPAVQNWESGIDLTMQQCTFYRSFSGYRAGALALWDVWPLVADISEIEFVHNEALVIPHDKFFWNVPQGPELRTGVTSVTVTDAYYDGGFSSDGIFTYAVPTEFWIVGTGAGEPGAMWNATWERAEWVDHGAFLTAQVIWVVIPPLPDKQLEMNVNLLDISIEDSAITAGGVRGNLDGRTFEYIASTGAFVSKGSRVERCSGNTPQGKGGATVKPPPAGALWRRRRRWRCAAPRGSWSAARHRPPPRACSRLTAR
eukprot:COSAG04_NODE_143_length_23569_cov_6.195356_2_plen_749_part_00